MKQLSAGPRPPPRRVIKHLGVTAWVACFTSPGHAGPRTPARSLDGSPTCCGCPGRGPGLPGARVTARSGRRTPPAGPASRESLAWRSRDTWWQRQGWESGPGSANPGDLKPHCAQGRSPLPLTVEPSARATEEEGKGHTQGCLPQRASRLCRERGRRAGRVARAPARATGPRRRAPAPGSSPRLARARLQHKNAREGRAEKGRTKCRPSSS